MQSTSFGARTRHRPQLHLVVSADRAERQSCDDRAHGARYPYRPSFHIDLPRTPQGRANRRDWILCWVIGPVLVALAGVVLIASNWR
jgi:hypothetical protein